MKKTVFTFLLFFIISPLLAQNKQDTIVRNLPINSEVISPEKFFNHFQTIYEVSGESIELFWLDSLVFLIIGVVIMRYNYIHNKSNKSRYNGFVLLSFFSIFNFIIFIILTPSYFYNYYNTMKIYHNKEFQIIEGNVQNFKEISYKSESFEVDGIKFEYSNAVFNFIGYRKTKFYGGEIDNNKYVKIGYITKNDVNVILKLEILRESPQKK
jgi:hypothetical protein